MTAQRITPATAQALFGCAATRAIEQAALAGLPPGTLMQRAGLAVARLAVAVAPHARRIWIACGPGNNGGDGLEAAAHLQAWGFAPWVTWLGTPERCPADARGAWQRAVAAGVALADAPPENLGAQDLIIDALLGIGARRAPDGRMAEWIARIHAQAAPVLAVDLPTGLDADTGQAQERAVRARHTLSLLTLKPGLFTADGRDCVGQVWWDDLGVHPQGSHPPPDAALPGPPAARHRAHASHKGTHGDVAVIGGAPGMAGAAWLAGRAALHAGAGRVYLALLGSTEPPFDPTQPELMGRRWQDIDLAAAAVVCGCGGGDAHTLGPVLPRVLGQAARLVLDADALNLIAADAALQTLLRQRAGRPTLLTPHPLEAARLLGITAAQVQADRLGAARQLAERLDCAVLLKGSGSITAAPHRVPLINPTGNPRLGTAGTGDVLAGLAGARLASGLNAFDAAWTAAWEHGAAADAWPSGQAFTAGELARALST